MRISDWSSDVCSPDLAKYDSFVASAFGDISGTKPAGIPDLSMSMGATYTHEFAGGTQAIAHIDYSYESPTQIVEGLSGFGSDEAGLLIAKQIKREVNALNAPFTEIGRTSCGERVCQE